uniref:Mitochondrial antiviral-signaling protein n=1 Tax=Catagonus wagneri TaxID=51154 RepID=A0A8C3WY97_9CETA
MTFAEDKTYQYIRNHHGNFCKIHVLEILPYLSCLTASDQDRLRASFERWGNQGTLWELFDSLRRRKGWVQSFIGALRVCELSDLADEVARVYQSSLLRNSNSPSTALEPSSTPAEAPEPSRPTVAPSIPYNGYREDEPSYPTPVQDTQPPEALGESSKTTPQPLNSGAVLKRPSGPLEPSSDVALSPLTSVGHQKQHTELGGTRTAGMVSGLTSPRGPVSPTVSFQPLARSTPRASRLPGPPVSAASSSTALAAAGGAGDQAEGTICSSGTGVPTNSVTASTVPSKVPTNSAFASSVPSKLPTSLKPSGAVSTNVPPSLAPSKLPINSARSGATSSKVPTGLVPDHKKPMSMVASKVPANTGPTGRSSNRLAKETPASPAPVGTAAGGTSPWPDSSSDRWDSEPELSKPGRLVSRMDCQPFSGCSEDLAISHSNPLGSGPDNTPEENEYVSVDTIRIRGDPSTPPVQNSPGPFTAPEFQAEEELEKGLMEVKTDARAPWLGVAVVGVLLATFLAVLYRRRLPQ